MLSHKHRKDQVHILTADAILATDVQERIDGDERTRSLSLRVPKASGDAAVAEVERMARETVASRLMILDVRGVTLPRLLKAYTQVVGFNRRDLNSLCYTLLIGDGPVSLLKPGKSLEVFVPHLARMRVDFSPAAYFFDPFLHYTDAEMNELRAAADPPQLTHIPRRLADRLSKQHMPVADVRRYFRAASAPPTQRSRAVARRSAKLVELFRRGLKKAYGEGAHNLTDLFTKEGYTFEAERLALHLYPLHFEDWVADLMQRAAAGAVRPRVG